MLKGFAAALLLATVTLAGSAQAMTMHKHMMMKPCAEGQMATAMCSCGEAMKGHAVMCKKGQWCHSMMHACTK